MVESDASKKTIGASLTPEIPDGNGCLERVLEYAASRSLKSAETRYFTIRGKLFAVWFGLNKFWRFLIEKHS
jgi:hypothetical protein